MCYLHSISERLGEINGSERFADWAGRSRSSVVLPQHAARGGFAYRLFDPALLALIVAAFVVAALLPNPLDPEGSIDAFIYHAYALDFSNLINRYGPFYFSYRIAHTFWIWAARVVFGFQHAQTALVVSICPRLPQAAG